jgi:hypothetical protein
MSAISSTLAAAVAPAKTQTFPLTAAVADQKAGAAASKPTTGVPPASTTIGSITSVTNADGSVTTTTEYDDGSETTATAPAPPAAAPSRGVPGLLNTSNAGQTATLLAAQEQATSRPGA